MFRWQGLGFVLPNVYAGEEVLSARTLASLRSARQLTHQLNATAEGVRSGQLASLAPRTDTSMPGVRSILAWGQFCKGHICAGKGIYLLYRQILGSSQDCCRPLSFRLQD